MLEEYESQKLPELLILLRFGAFFTTMNDKGRIIKFIFHKQLLSYFNIKISYPTYPCFEPEIKKQKGQGIAKLLLGRIVGKGEGVKVKGQRW